MSNLLLKKYPISRSTRVLLLLFALANILLLLRSAQFYGGFLRGTDGQMYYAQVRSIIIDQDIDFNNEFKSLTPFPKKLKPETVPATGMIANKYPIGFAIISTPLFAATHLATKLSNHYLGTSFDRNGYSKLYTGSVALSHLLVALLGIYSALQVLARFSSEKLALVALFTTWLSTPLVYYASVFPFMAHASGAGLIALACLLSIKLAENPSKTLYILAGFVFALIILLRPSNVLLIALPIALYFHFKKDSPPPGPRYGSIIAAEAFAILLLFQCLVWTRIYGSPIVYSYSGEKFNLLKPALKEILVSTNHGLFIWMPIIGLAVLGWLVKILSERSSILAKSCLMAATLLFYLNASWSSWWFGDAFGPRAFTELFIYIALGLVWLFSSLKLNWKEACLGVFPYLAWNIYLLIMFLLGRIPASGEFPMSKLFSF